MLKKIAILAALAFGLAQADSYITDGQMFELLAQPNRADTIRSQVLIDTSLHDTTFYRGVLGTDAADSVLVACNSFKDWARCRVTGGSFTSDSAGFALVAFPSGWRPGVNMNYGGIAVTNNSVLRRGGGFTLSTAGAAVFVFPGTVGTDSTWTNTGTKAFATFGIEFKK